MGSAVSLRKVNSARAELLTPMAMHTPIVPARIFARIRLLPVPLLENRLPVPSGSASAPLDDCKIGARWSLRNRKYCAGLFANAVGHCPGILPGKILAP